MSETIDEQHIWKVIKSFFEKKGLVHQQIEHFNYYINHGIQEVIDEESGIEIIPKKGQRYVLKFSEIWVSPPGIIEEDRNLKLIYPQEARRRDINYDSAICCDITETLYADISVEDSKKVEEKIIEETVHRRTVIGRTPIMLRSDKCNLTKMTIEERIKAGECEKDSGGYFVIRGNERVIVSQLRGNHNQVIVLKQKEGEKYANIAEIRSMSEETGHSVQLRAMIGSDDRTIVFSLPYIKEVMPIGIVFKALGFNDNNDIIKMIGVDSKKTSKYMRLIDRDSFFIKTQKDALEYIGSYSIHTIAKEKRFTYAKQVCETELFPHLGVGSTNKEIAIMLGHMVNQLISTHIGMREPDDRDNYSNKRCETAGILCTELFRTLFKRYINSIKLVLEKKKTHLDGISVIKKSNGITTGLKHCFPAGTMITMTNGLSIRIEKLSEKGGEYILGWNGYGFIPSSQTGLIKQGVKHTIRLTFESGKTLVCTPNHKILVMVKGSPSWVEAKDIPVDSRVIACIEYPEDDMELNSDWKLDVSYQPRQGIKSQTFDISTQENRNKTLALTRMIGYILSDWCRRNGGSVCFGSMIDVQIFIQDYKLVTGKIPVFHDRISEKWGRVFSINLRTELTHIIRGINGMCIGKKTIQGSSAHRASLEQASRLPEFILDPCCPVSIVREFLGGLFGGDGHCPHLDIRKKQRTCITGVAFSWTTDIKYINNICTLLKRVGVPDAYLNGPYKPSSGQEDRLYYRLHTQPNTNFSKKVGFRYCTHKAYKLTIASLYWEMEENIKKQHKFVTERANKLKEEKGRKISIKTALETARKELKEKEYVLNEYYSLSRSPDAEEYIRDMGVLGWFNVEYMNHRDSIEIPCFTTKLVDIREDKPQEVYDIGVNETHSFLAGGHAVHNCFSTGNWGVQKNAYIRTGVSQVMSRMTYGATLSHLRRIVIPIGKEGKNAKIRQIHSSQFGFICPAECFDPETLILLWDGNIIQAHKIKVGDLLIDDKGFPTKVKSTCAGYKRMFEIQQNNSMNYTVTDNHILTLKIKRHKKILYIKKIDRYEVMWFNKKTLVYKRKYFKTIEQAEIFNLSIDDDIIDITIEDYLKLSENIRKQLYGFRCDKINWPQQEIKLDPYILGMWLGDGLSTGYGFSSADKEIISAYEEWGKDNDATIRHIKKYSYGISSTTQTGTEFNRSERTPLKKLLEVYKLINNKHIPKEYLINDRDTRLKVLAGLIDTDGHVRANGHEIRICQGPKNKQVIYDALFLARSLGFSCHINDGKSQSTAGNGEKRPGFSTELIITGEYLYEIPTRLQRKKLNNFRIKCSSFLQTPINVIEKDIGRFVGWQLEGNGRFLLGDFTTVHNTPEGQSAGIVLNLSLLARVTKKIPTSIVKEVLEQSKNIIPIINVDLNHIKDSSHVFLNGILIGMTQFPDTLVDEIINIRRSHRLDKDVSVTYDMIDNIVRVYCDAGRCSRPLFTIGENGLNITSSSGSNWNKLVNKNLIEYVDNSEIENYTISMTPETIGKWKNDYCEIHPSMLHGVMASNIPFPDHSQSPRNCYQCLDPKELVYMSDGSRKPIGAIKIGERVITINPTTCEQSITTVINHYIKKTDKNIIKLTTESGRSIICTDDHLMLTTTGWVKAKYAETVCIIPQQIVYDNYDTAELVYVLPEIKSVKKHTKKLESLGLFPVKPTYLPILARMVGYLLSDGSAGIYKGTPQIQMTFGSVDGRKTFEKDVEYLGFLPNTVQVSKNPVTKVYSEKYGKCEQIIYNNSLASLLIGITYNYTGKRSTQTRQPLMKWITHGSKLIKREFLAGFQGGDGCKIRYNRKSGNFILNSTSQTSKNEYVGSLMIFMEEIKKIFEEFNILCTGPVTKENGTTDSKSVHLYFSNTRSNLINYFEKVGWKYDQHKYDASLPIYEYLKLCEYQTGKIIEERKQESIANKSYNYIKVYQEWIKDVVIKNGAIFVKVDNTLQQPTGLICDITTESDNHSFIAGDSICVHNCSMGKQALGIYALSHQQRTDTISHVLNYPQRPIVGTKPGEFMGFNDMPSGINAIVAVMSYTGLTLALVTTQVVGKSAL